MASDDTAESKNIFPQFPAKNVRRLVVDSDTAYTVLQLQFEKIRHFTINTMTDPLLQMLVDDSINSLMASQYLRSIGHVLNTSRSTLTTIRLTLNQCHWSSLLHLLEPFPPNLEKFYLSSTGDHREWDHKAPSNFKPKFLQLVVDQRLGSPALEIFSNILEHLPIFAFAMKTHQVSSPQISMRPYAKGWKEVIRPAEKATSKKKPTRRRRARKPKKQTA